MNHGLKILQTQIHSQTDILESQNFWFWWQLALLKSFDNLSKSSIATEVKPTNELFVELFKLLIVIAP